MPLDVDYRLRPAFSGDLPFSNSRAEKQTMKRRVPRRRKIKPARRPRYHYVRRLSPPLGPALLPPVKFKGRISALEIFSDAGATEIAPSRARLTRISSAGSTREIFLPRLLPPSSVFIQRGRCDFVDGLFSLFGVILIAGCWGDDWFY